MLIFENSNTFLVKNVFSFTDFREKEYRIAPKRIRKYLISKMRIIKNVNTKFLLNVFAFAFFEKKEYKFGIKRIRNY